MKKVSRDQQVGNNFDRKYHYEYVNIADRRIFVKYNMFVYFVIQVFVPIKYEPIYRMGKWCSDAKVVRTATYGNKVLIEILVLPSILERGDIHDGFITSMGSKLQEVVNKLIRFNK